MSQPESSNTIKELKNIIENFPLIRSIQVLIDFLFLILFIARLFMSFNS